MGDDLHDSIWKAKVEQAGLSNAGGLLRSEARPCFRVASLVPEDYSETGNSRFGGEPDLPVDFDWPLDDGISMSFLAQINLSELTPSFVPDLPPRGWLYFFLGLDNEVWNLPHQIYFYDGPAGVLQRRALPLDVTQGDNYFPRTFVPHRVRFEPAFSIKYESPVWEQLGIGIFKIPHTFCQERTQIRGHALEYTGDPAFEAYIYKNNLPPPPFTRQAEEKHFVEWIESAMKQGDEAKVEALKKKLWELHSFKIWLRHHEPKIDLWQSLFILESHRAVDMLWGDAGHLQFMIQEDDLLSQRFDNTFCVLLST